MQADWSDDDSEEDVGAQQTSPNNAMSKRKSASPYNRDASEDAGSASLAPALENVMDC